MSSNFEARVCDVTQRLLAAADAKAREAEARDRYTTPLVAELDTQMAFNLQSTLDDMFRPPSRLQSLVDRAVEASRQGPDLALNLDICDLVNRKKGNYAHEAVFALLPYVNGRSSMQGLLALTLLDNLIKNCGHPVHYQVASREFLNELFRRFPEYQPRAPSPVHYRILEMLQEWRVTLCQRSRHREDLQRINDMYSLLCRKGWRFPKIDSDNIAVVLEPEDTLKTREELEKEDMDAMQAKLQELLRRATPRDLREANKLMKVITGYEESAKQRDYDREWEDELQVLERKIALLYEILQGALPGRPLDETALGLLSKCTSSRARLRKLITEHESIADNSSADTATAAAAATEAAGAGAGDEGAEETRELARLIRLSDLISGAERAVDDLKHGRQPELGDLSAVGDLGDSQAPPGPGGGDELISWDDGAAAEDTLAAAAAPVSPVDDLAGLSFHTLAAPTAGGTAHLLPPPPRAQSQPMSNPSLPTNAQQARSGRGPDKLKDAFDFSDLLSAAKSASRAGTPARPAVGAEATPDPRAAPNASRTTSWGSSPDPGSGNGGGSGSGGSGALIDFLS
ncbi:ARF-binding protein [Coemansia biformis]|uniref:ARF-binding protein n=1 Tax=Coemansia biformis TaxID=1286918 RepID=A0A9W7YC08_9FUNG|nr:ARF-binding protein [Coemansia biformis]